ncbi:MAG: glycerophosphodiester phosphodiesterase [Clostridium sp.]
MGKEKHKLIKNTIMDLSDSRKIIRNTFNNFSLNYKSFIFFEFLYKLLAIFLIIPINYFILDRLLGGMGVSNITNTDLIRIGLSLEGILYIFLILGVSYIAVFFEMSILTYMAQKSHKGEKVSLLEAGVNSFRIIPKTISFYMFPLIFIAGFVGPLTGVGLYNSLIQHLTVPSFIKLELFKSLGGRIFYYGVFAALLVVLFRWLLAIPAVVIEKVSLQGAFKRSVNCYKSDRVKLISYLTAWVVVNIVLRVIILYIYTEVGDVIINALGPTGLASGIFMVMYITLFFVGYIIISTMTLPLFISFLVELYYTYPRDGVEYREFEPVTKYQESKPYKFIIRNKKRFIVGVISIFFIFSAITASGISFGGNIYPRVDVTAHRGSSMSAPENSISAIEAAIMEGADYAEIDVMLTKDKQVVLFHDNNLKRIDGSNRRIKDMTLNEIRAIDNGSYFSKDFAGEKIPTLKEVLEVAKGKIKLNVELKTVSSEDTLPEEVGAIIKETKMEGQVVVSSLDYQALMVFKLYQPSIDVGYIVTFGFGDLSNLDVDFLSMEYGMVNKKRVEELHSIGKKVHVWTLNAEEEILNAAQMDVDNIITDNPSLAKGLTEFPIEYMEIDYMNRFHNIIDKLLKYL